MDALTEEGVVLLGGPVGEGDGEDALLIVDVDSEAAICARLADDPWGDDMLTIKSVEPWSVLLRAPEARRLSGRRAAADWTADAIRPPPA